MTDSELLNQYAIEINSGSLTLSSLIESHRRLRAWNMERQNAIEAEFREAYNKGYALGAREATEQAIVSRIRELSMLDLANLIVSREVDKHG